jgi:SOS-response transcriptional repressor LexA
MPLPTKKQRELLDFISQFIGEYGYSPSYREIKSGLSYGSIATVAKHVDNLVVKGMLAKRQHSARSLEPLAESGIRMPEQLRPKTPAAGQKWLIDTVDARFRMIEANAKRSPADVDRLTVLVSALQILGLDGAASAFATRLRDLQK